MLARVALVGAGLLAGAVSMAIAIAALHYLGHRGAPPPPPPSGAPAPPAAPAGQPLAPETSSGAAPTTTVVEPSSAPVTAPSTEGTEGTEEPIPTGVEPPPASADPTPRRSPRERGREAGAAAAPGTQAAGGTQAGGSQAGGTQAGGSQPGGGTAQWPGAADPVELAARALAGGHPEECVEILDDVIARGATPFALKRRGDCLMRAGRRDDAIRDYQRFCRIAPDHPATGGVREQLAGMGLTCP